MEYFKKFGKVGTLMLATLVISSILCVSAGVISMMISSTDSVSITTQHIWSIQKSWVSKWDCTNMQPLMKIPATFTSSFAWNPDESKVVYFNINSTYGGITETFYPTIVITNATSGLPVEEGEFTWTLYTWAGVPTDSVTGDGHRDVGFYYGISTNPWISNGQYVISIDVPVPVRV